MGINSTNLNQSGKTDVTSIVWLVAGALAIIAGGFVLGLFVPVILPRQAGAEAAQVDGLFHFLLVVGGAIFFLVEGALIYSIIKFRRRAGDRTDGPNVHGSTMLELIWTVIPAIIVFVITIYSYNVWVSIQSPKADEQVIGVQGARYAWTFFYTVPISDFPADADVEALPDALRERVDELGGILFASSQMHTWVGQPVKTEMQTADVIHSLWIPAMRVKQDLLPGRVTEARFTPTEPGTYRIVCTELCGSGHGDMAGTVTGQDELLGAWLIVHPDEETYRREFLEPELNVALNPPDDPVLVGRGLLESGQYPCASCHILDDLGWQGNVGPTLNGIGDRAESRVAGQTAGQYLANSMRNPASYLVPGFGNLMPQFNDEPGESNYMPDEDLLAIVAYLLSLTEDADM